MPHNRYFLEVPLQQGETVTLEGIEFHHLARVMRTQIGDTVELVNGKHVLAEARVSLLTKEKASLHILSSQVQEPPKKEIILAQALPKLSSLEWILEKGTELGATQFWLFPGVLSEKEMKSQQLPKLRQWVIAALKQCGRLDLPKMILKPPLSQWEKPNQSLFFGDIRPSAPYSKLHSADILFFIGPEKGFHPQEITLLESWQAKGVKLHTNILRTETAALVALTYCSMPAA